MATSTDVFVGCYFGLFKHSLFLVEGSRTVIKRLISQEYNERKDKVQAQNVQSVGGGSVHGFSEGKSSEFNHHGFSEGKSSEFNATVRAAHGGPGKKMRCDRARNRGRGGQRLITINGCSVVNVQG